jgi:hypothetical protein
LLSRQPDRDHLEELLDQALAMMRLATCLRQAWSNG